MYISYNFLKDFLKFPKAITPEEISEKLTNQTVEVEHFSRQAEQFNKVVVGRVLSVDKHPNADRLRLATVDVKTEKLHIVCGAPNLAEGQKVAVALVGAVLPGGLEIKESEIRGEKSSGMICAEDELGLGKNHEGIMVLNKSAKIGEDLASYLEMDDIIFEVDNKSLSNRPDLLNHYGIARELSAIFDLNLKPYESFGQEIIFSEDKKNKLEVKVNDQEACSRYLVVKIDNVKVAPSPQWLKNRLVALDQKPINNIVDLTNYVMFEIGQPLHAFDAAKVQKITVRHAAKNERLETLDEKERILDEKDLLITNGKTPLAIAGIIGGKESGISEETTSLVLEAANFNAGIVRQTSQKINLRTEASIRFEKSLDTDLPLLALKRFLSLLKELCPEMKIASSLTDINNGATKKIEIDLNFSWLNKKIGQEIEPGQVVKYLEKLGFKIIEQNSELVRVLVPAWRATKDIRLKEDLVEEILRLYGYNNIISQLPQQTLGLPVQNPARLLERKIKNILVWKHSLFEVYNYSFVGEEQLKKLDIDFLKHLRIINPLSEVHGILRQSLIPNLVLNVRNNQFKAADLGFFEIGNVFFSNFGNLKKDNVGEETLPHQETKLSLAISGEKRDLFSELKGIISNLLQNLVDFGLETDFLSLENLPAWSDKSTAAKIVVCGREIGLVSLLKMELGKNFNLKKPIALAELDLKTILDLVLDFSNQTFKELPKYPPVVRDLAFVVTDKILYNDLKKEISAFSPLIRSVELFDVYAGDKLAANQKSLAFHVSYLSAEKTLIASEIDVMQNALVGRLAEKFGAQLRDF